MIEANAYNLKIKFGKIVELSNIVLNTIIPNWEAEIAKYYDEQNDK
jgi:hypothetical protein